MKFTIITAVYNNSSTLESALNLFSLKVITDIEHIVVDGGSTDGSVEILKQVQDDKEEMLKQVRMTRDGDKDAFRWISERDEGIYDALNKGIKLASGDVIGLLHSDDVFADEFVIEKIAALFEKDNADMVYSDLEYIDSKGKTFRKWHSGDFKTLRFGWMPPHPTLFVKKELFDLMEYIILIIKFLLIMIWFCGCLVKRV